MSSSDYRARAREALRGNWPVAVLVCFIAGLIGGTSYGSSLSFNFEEDLEPIIDQISPELAIILLGIAGVLATIGSIIALIHFLIGGAAKLGLARYHLNLIDRKEARFEDLFSQFSRFTDALVLQLLITLFITLWSLLLFIPGIIASYRYSMAYYIMLEDPNCSAREAINRSKIMMDGHKGDLFILDLSFIGWHLLAGLTLGLGNLFVTPYEEASRAVFYRNLSEAQRRQNPNSFPEND